MKGMSEIVMDPNIISACFSTEDIEGMWDEGDPRDDEIELMRSKVHLLSDDDILLYQYLYDDIMPQAQIIELTGVPQSSLSQRVSSLTAKLKFLVEMPKRPSEDLIEDNLSRLRPQAAKVIRMYLDTPSQQIVANTLDTRIQSVWRYVNNTVTKVDLLDPEFIEYLRVVMSSPTNITRLV